MPRSLPCLVAAMSLLACPLPADDDEATTAAQSTGSTTTTTTAAPTTGDDHGETTAPPATTGPGDDSDSTTEIGECWLELHASATAPRVMLVLDKSGSMVSDSGHWDHDADPNTPEVTRWRSLHATVEALVGEFEGRIDFGAVLFPSVAATSSYSAAACPVEATPEVPVGPGHAAQILAAIPDADATDLRGGTPTTAAIRTALAGLAAVDPDAPAQPRAIVLVTDGAANCSTDPIDDENASLFEVYDETLAPTIADALAQQNITTHVVGIDIVDEISSDAADGEPDLTNTFARLNELAEAGGHPRPGPVKFHSSTNQLELESALQEVFALTTSCVIDLGRSLDDFLFIQRLEVDTLDGEPLRYDWHEVEDCALESGWHFTDATRSAVELCGDACTSFQATGELDIVLDCHAR